MGVQQAKARTIDRSGEVIAENTMLLHVVATFSHRPFPVALPSSMTLMASALVGLHTLKNSVVAASGGKSSPAASPLMAQSPKIWN
eukprot:2436631-Amphidinium_carterae.1